MRSLGWLTVRNGELLGVGTMTVRNTASPLHANCRHPHSEVGKVGKWEAPHLTVKRQSHTRRTP